MISDSASGRSNGVRLTSAMLAIKQDHERQEARAARR